MSQDFGEYSIDERRRLGGHVPEQDRPYQYGAIDVLSNIWSIPLEDASFDAILCTEVLEHVPYPIASVKELSRLLRPGGQIILTVPNASLRHQDPYFFTSGFSDRWLERILPEAGLEITELTPLGDYYSWLRAQIFGLAAVNGPWAAALMTPAFLYLAAKRPSVSSIETLTEGYLVVARKSVDIQTVE